MTCYPIRVDIFFKKEKKTREEMPSNVVVLKKFVVLLPPHCGRNINQRVVSFFIKGFLKPDGVTIKLLSVHTYIVFQCANVGKFF